MMTTSYSDRKFEERKDNSLYNTSYPLFPSDWAEYETDGPLAFDANYPIAYYVHIPFCRQLCSFCEYTRMCVPSEPLQKKYVDTLLSDISNFRHKYPDQPLYGFDIGGGTPTALSTPVFEHLLESLYKIISSSRLTENFEPSIEATFQTISKEKARITADCGIRRISLGIQSTSDSVLSPLHRESMSWGCMAETIATIHNSGITKVNLDLMYGLPDQSIETIERDLECIRFLAPEQATLYELRSNQLKQTFLTATERNYLAYSHLFEGLNGMGYHCHFGQNTFSKNEKDCGLSSYLRHRMFDGWQYRGFGLSAQSMSAYGISYNLGKNIRQLKEYISVSSFDSGKHYKLPPHELLNKYIAISGYCGRFSTTAAEKFYGNRFMVDFADVIEYLLANNYITTTNNQIALTPDGFQHYGAVMSLFY